MKVYTSINCFISNPVRWSTEAKLCYCPNTSGRDCTFNVVDCGYKQSLTSLPYFSLEDKKNAASHVTEKLLCPEDFFLIKL